MSGKLSGSSFYALLVDGYDLLAAKVKTFSYKISSGTESGLGLGDSFASKLPTGLATLLVTQAGAFFDDSTAGMHALLKVAGSGQVSRVLFAAFAGNTIGKPFMGASGVYAMEYEPAPAVAALTKANVAYAVSGAVDQGVIISNFSAQTADWNTKTNGSPVDYALDPTQNPIGIASATKANPCVITTLVPHGLSSGHIILPTGNTLSGPNINSKLAVTVLSSTTLSVPVNTSASTGAGTGGTFVRCNSVNGGSGIQATSAMSGLTGFVGTYRHSVDDTTYVDLVSHTNVTSAPAAERVTVAAGTTVHEFLCFNGDVTGSGSITSGAGFTRA